MKTFGKEPEMLTVMVQGADPDRIRELMTLSIPEGAEAFGMQFEQLRPEYRTKETYRELFAFAGIRPGDTLLVLGDEKNGLLVTPPDVMHDVARQIFQNLEEEENQK